MLTNDLFYLQKGHIYAVPIIHYNMEMATQVKWAFDTLKPDCVAVELPETMQVKMLHAASRLPDISVVLTYNQDHDPVYFMAEPCDPIFEALRSSMEHQVPAYCIDLDVDHYPDIHEQVPDPYAIHRIGLKAYYNIYEQARKENRQPFNHLDQEREIYMARRLKELSLRYDRILFVGGMAHLSQVLKLVDNRSFPEVYHADRGIIELCTLTPESARDILFEWGYLSYKYETMRENFLDGEFVDRQKVILQLYKEASEKYVESTGNFFAGYHLRNIMKFVRNYALVGGQLMPDLYKILSSAKGCVDNNYAYEVWELATFYPFLKNIDNLPELDLSIEDVWGYNKQIRFYLKEKGRKNSIPKVRKDRSSFRFTPPNPFSICSYPPEDIAIEKFGDFLKKKGCQILAEEGARTIPFSSSIEDGIDTKETIRHWHERKLFVKTKGKPPAGVGSICLIFDEDKAEEGKPYQEKYPWRTTWIGEHQQESDMSFYATSLSHQVVGPGISRCEYGGFMMSYPPRRMRNIWFDPDYFDCRFKSEVLLMAAIDYAVKPIIVYVASTPPRSQLKSFARRFGKKIVYIPIGQLSPITLNKLRAFHVLDGHDKREIADEYIY
ncbi:hypothetical protein [Candidatus Protochlamydia amoebophila]|uniref:Uncharacterized protein n=1 Tax=Candidatus Protochlamydia amoebophila TaxID=362787 RepID=A0A0C1JNW6_9BACT|nr:hypothetical protein [Candidatus Protochlamydia amoebophila]KIC72231.1 hypothetical protein DB44_CN00370 [Candidatus Protochlamydia amoebophila]